MSSAKKIVVVFGATGAAGGSVVRYLLRDGTFAIRAVTRNSTSEKAKGLAAQGVEVVEADLAKPETLPGVLHGAYGVSALSDFWNILPTVGFDTAAAQAEETRQGKALVDAAKAAAVQHFVWFTLPEGDSCPHFAGKVEVEKYVQASGVPHTIYCNQFYYENLAIFKILQKREDGSILLNIPAPQDIYIPCYSVDQTGGWVLEAFKNPSKWIGQTMTSLGDLITPRQMATVLSNAVGKPVVPRELSYEEFEAQADSDDAIVRELYTMYKLFLDRWQPPASDGIVAKFAEVYPEQHDFETFVKENVPFKQFFVALA